MQIRGGGRSRTLSQPAKPNSPAGRSRVDSLTSPTPRERPVSSLSHHRSSSSLHHNHTPSRASSPASSTTHDPATEIQQLRERNWNSSHPNWSVHSVGHSHAQHRSQEDSPRPLSVNGHKRRDSSPSSSTSGNERIETSSSRANGVQDDSSSHDETSKHSNVSRHASSISLRPRASLRDRPHSPSLGSKLSDPTAPTTPITSPRLASRAKVIPSHDRTTPASKSIKKPANVERSSAHQHKQVDQAGFVSHIPVRSKVTAELSPNYDNHSEENEQHIVSATSGDVVPKFSVAIDSAALHESDWETNDGTRSSYSLGLYETEDVTQYI